MTTEIQQELSRLEIQHNIQILYAVESGSRAWGFASVNSDWDVRTDFCYRLIIGQPFVYWITTNA